MNFLLTTWLKSESNWRRNESIRVVCDSTSWRCVRSRSRSSSHSINLSGCISGLRRPPGSFISCEVAIVSSPSAHSRKTRCRLRNLSESHWSECVRCSTGRSYLPRTQVPMSIAALYGTFPRRLSQELPRIGIQERVRAYLSPSPRPTSSSF
jgi:hypothetical protein